MLDVDIVSQLQASGLVRKSSGRLRTTRRFQAAMARAAVRLQEAGDVGTDLRVPIAAAVVDLFPGLTDGDAARLVDALLPIEVAELGGPAVK